MLVTISDLGANAENILYIKQGLNELINHTGGEIRTTASFDRAYIKIDCPEYYGDIIKCETIDKIAEVIAIKYKYDFFKKEIKVGGLCENEKEILYASLISADFEDDKKYTFEKIKNFDTISIDGMFNFMLMPLKRKWKDIVSYMPQCFLSGQLKDFILYLLEPKRKKAYVDNGRVFDNNYRRLKRADLLDGENVKITREVLLCNCGEIEITGKIPQDDEKYLKEYYGDRIIFRSNLS